MIDESKTIEQSLTGDGEPFTPEDEDIEVWVEDILDFFVEHDAKDPLIIMWDSGNPEYSCYTGTDKTPLSSPLGEDSFQLSSKDQIRFLAEVKRIIPNVEITSRESDLEEAEKILEERYGKMYYSKAKYICDKIRDNFLGKPLDTMEKYIRNMLDTLDELGPDEQNLLYVLENACGIENYVDELPYIDNVVAALKQLEEVGPPAYNVIRVVQIDYTHYDTPEKYAEEMKITLEDAEKEFEGYEDAGIVVDTILPDAFLIIDNKNKEMLTEGFREYSPEEGGPAAYIYDEEAIFLALMDNAMSKGNKKLGETFAAMQDQLENYLQAMTNIEESEEPKNAKDEKEALKKAIKDMAEQAKKVCPSCPCSEEFVAGAVFKAVTDEDIAMQLLEDVYAMTMYSEENEKMVTENRPG